MQASSGSGGRTGPASPTAQPQDSKHRTGPQSAGIQAPSISLPKGGGVIRGIREKFGANSVTGTGFMTVLIATSPGRSAFGAQLSLSCDSGAGNVPFGFGWSLSVPNITRKNDNGLSRYWDDQKSDEFILSGAEGLCNTHAAGCRQSNDSCDLHT